MKIQNAEVELLSNITKALTEKIDPLEFVNTLKQVLNRYGRVSGTFIELNKVNLYIYEENTRLLRDYGKNYIPMESENLYLAFKQFSINQFSFFLNNKAYKLEDILNFAAVKSFNDNNVLLIPLRRDNTAIGMIELCFSGTVERLLNYDFFILMAVIAYQISLKIQNTILAEQMNKNIKFHESMKNIAKIIETQYELNYIIPLIGEMIDRFVSNHFIYIFLGNGEDREFKLVWPDACKDKDILNLLPKLTANSTFILTEGEKVGIFPLVGKKALLGCIVAHSKEHKLTKKELDYLQQLSTQSSITLQRANAYADVLKHATIDALTSLNNRRQFEIRLKQEYATATRHKNPLCAVMIDIDFFKKVNDTYGHIVGDCVLKSVASKIKKSIRESDIASRYGGEEFSILLPNTNLEEAYKIAERLRKTVEDSDVQYLNEKGEVEVTVHVTISMGIYQLKETDSPQDLYQKADKGLYEAKSTGRNKVVLYKGE